MLRLVAPMVNTMTSSYLGLGGFKDDSQRGCIKNVNIPPYSAGLWLNASNDFLLLRGEPARNSLC